MPSIGAVDLSRRFNGSALAVAEALLLNELRTWEIDQVGEVVSPLVLEAARIRLEAMGKLNPAHIKPAKKKS